MAVCPRIATFAMYMLFPMSQWPQARMTGNRQPAYNGGYGQCADLKAMDASFESSDGNEHAHEGGKEMLVTQRNIRGQGCTRAHA